MSQHAGTAAAIGGGPAGLMAAEALAAAGARVTVYDRMPSLGRKFLMAGRGGLNLTHSEALAAFLARYGQAAPQLRTAVDAFPSERLRAWSDDLGQPTFVGSSGRVFPTAMKASPLLRAWLRRLDSLGVQFAARHRWTGWDHAGALQFETPGGPHQVDADVTVLALGGASWPQLGSDGAWVAPVSRAELAVTPLVPSNCGFAVSWSPLFRDRHHGEPLKNVVLRFGALSARGDLVVTRDGLEGGPLYALSPALRDSLRDEGNATLHLGLRPDMSPAQIAARLDTRRAKQSLSNTLRKNLRLSPVAIGLLREAPGLSALPTADLAERINRIPIALTGTAPLARAISTAGGLNFTELDDAFMLHRRPGTFAAGEMLDWDAPTGGYLLQACFATGLAAGQGAAAWLRQRRADARAD